MHGFYGRKLQPVNTEITQILQIFIVEISRLLFALFSFIYVCLRSVGPRVIQAPQCGVQYILAYAVGGENLIV